MSKRVALNAKIVFGGIDISTYVTRWSVGAAVNTLYMAEIDVLDNPGIIEIVKDVRQKNGMRVAFNDRIILKGGRIAGNVDVGRWVRGYEKVSKVGDADVIRLHVQCDSEALSINDTTPWEEPNVVR